MLYFLRKQCYEKEDRLGIQILEAGEMEAGLVLKPPDDCGEAGAESSGVLVS